jgi:tetratricopeptide (TPR) repeat protein
MSTNSALLDYLGKDFVLVIEPSSNYRVSLKNFLTNLKVKNFRLVNSVAEARREMLTTKVGLFICEWSLPEKNGLVFCRELRKEKAFKNTPFLLLSAESFRKDVILAGEVGVSSYLLKPFSFEDFTTQLNALIYTAKNPSPIQRLLEKAEEQIEIKEAWVAQELVQEALTIKPNSARAHSAMGRVHLLNKDLTQALASFKTAVNLNQEYVDGYKFILQIAEEQNDPQAILQTATVLHNLSPENPRYPLSIARAHMELGNLDLSEELFKKCIKLSPTLTDAYKGLGGVYLEKKDYENALKSFEKALDLDQGDVSTINSLGLAYVKQGRFEEGIKRYKLALSISQFDPRVHFNMGLAYSEMGETHLAREAYQRAIAADPSHEKAKRQLVRLDKNLPLTDRTDDENTPSSPTKKPA